MSIKVENTQKAYSRPEELTSFVTYAIAAALSFVGLVFLLLKSTSLGGLAVTAAVLCGIMPAAVFTVGAALHLFPVGSRLRLLARRLDRCAVGLLALGVFAPIMLIGMQSGAHADSVWGYSLFAVIAAAALAAAAINLFDVSEYKLASLVLYVVIGCAAVLRISRIIELCGWDCFWLLFGGGALYFIGTIVCAFEGLPARHAVWHVFVTGGAVLHFVCIYMFVL